MLDGVYRLGECEHLMRPRLTIKKRIRFVAVHAIVAPLLRVAGRAYSRAYRSLCLLRFP